MAALVQLLAVPLMLLNFFGGIASGIWLAVLGEWSAIGIGLVLSLGSSLFLTFAMLPQFVFGFPAVWCFDRGFKVAGYFFSALSLAYLYALISAWSGAILWFFMGRVTSHALLVPMLVWSYSVATAPWSYMASREAQAGGGEGAAMTCFNMQLGYIVMMLMILFGNPTFFEVMAVFVAMMCVGLVISMFVIGAQTRYARA